MASDLDRAGAAAAAVGAPAGGRETDHDDRLTRIRPATRWPRFDLRELWHYRELLGIFVWRDIKVRYKETVVGAGWAIFQLALMAFVYVVVFGRFATLPLGEHPLRVVHRRRAAALAVLLVLGDVRRRLARLERQPRDEGLLPAPVAPARHGVRARARLLARPRRARRDDGLVRHLAARGPGLAGARVPAARRRLPRSASRCCCRRRASVTGTSRTRSRSSSRSARSSRVFRTTSPACRRSGRRSWRSTR